MVDGGGVIALCNACCLGKNMSLAKSLRNAIHRNVQNARLPLPTRANIRTFSGTRIAPLAFVWFTGRPLQTNLTPPASRHEFAISRAGPDDPFHGKGSRYTCIHCKWSFIVKGLTVVVLDDNGRPMKGKLADMRFDTFADGPCPALADER